MIPVPEQRGGNSRRGSVHGARRVSLLCRVRVDGALLHLQKPAHCKPATTVRHLRVT